MTRLTISTEGDRQVVVTRRFAAAPAAVWRAHTEPALLERWLLGPDGWRMTDCVSEPRPGGRIRFVWTNGERSFSLTGAYLELEPHARILHVERMHLPETTPDNHVETRFEPVEGGTRLVLTMTLPDAESRAAMLASGMEHGMEASYARLEAQLGAPVA